MSAIMESVGPAKEKSNTVFDLDRVEGQNMAFRFVSERVDFLRGQHYRVKEALEKIGKSPNNMVINDEIKRAQDKIDDYTVVLRVLGQLKGQLPNG